MWDELVLTACGQSNRGIVWVSLCLLVISFSTLVAVRAICDAARDLESGASLSSWPYKKEKDLTMHRKGIRTAVLLVAILLLPLLVIVVQQTSLLIEGPQENAKVIQVQGKNYVEVDQLARITGGALRFLGNQIILTFPASGDTSLQDVQSAPAPPIGYSREFVNAGIETMRETLNGTLR
jgi:hypothetical protein